MIFFLFNVFFLTLQASPENRFVPSQEWFDDWHKRLPLETILRALHVLVPQVEALCASKSVTNEVEILEFLQNGTLVGLLPMPHPIVIRKQRAPIGPCIWLYSFVWSIIYVKCVALRFFVFIISRRNYIIYKYDELFCFFSIPDCFSWCALNFYRNMFPAIWHGTNIKLLVIKELRQ
jgi:hypothetical protein